MEYTIRYVELASIQDGKPNEWRVLLRGSVRPEVQQVLRFIRSDAGGVITDEVRRRSLLERYGHKSWMAGRLFELGDLQQAKQVENEAAELAERILEAQ